MLDSASQNEKKYWESPEVVAKYSRKPFLLRGERSAFASCFPDGLSGKCVLDLGCGTGRTTHFLHKMGADVLGVDISRNLIAAARHMEPHIDFREGNAVSMEFADESFDAVVFSFNGLDCIHPKDARLKAIHEVHRVLSPKGRFIFSNHNLAALFFGWYKFMRPWKLLFRAKHILNGDVLKRECYLSAPQDSDGLLFYYAWPKQVSADMVKCGFNLLHIYPNSLFLDFIQSSLRTNFFTKLADPWPYYIFCKT